ncbi:MAG: glycosyltransferase family 39 protein [Thermoleophilaceae bacterium]
MRSRGSRALLIILAVALLARLVVIVATPDFKPIFDAAHYDRLGASIAHGHGYPGQFDPATPSAFRPPLYPLALAAVHLVGGGWTAERVLSALLGVVAVLLVFLVAERLWGRRVALVAAAIAAVFPPLVVLSASLLSESLFVPLTLGVVLATLEYRRTRQLRWAVAAGALGGLGALTRTNGLLLVLAAAIGVWVARPLLRRSSLMAPTVVAVAAVVVVTPWVVRNTIEFHRFVGISTQTGYALGATYNPQAGRLHPAGTPRMTWLVYPGLFHAPLDEGERSSRLTNHAIDYATGHPSYVVKTLVWNTLRVFDLHHDGSFKTGFQAGYLQAVGDARLASPLVPIAIYVVLALALVGAAGQAGLVRTRRAPVFVWAFPVLLVVPAIAVFGLSRYRSPIDPFLAMLAAVALVAVFERVSVRGAAPAYGTRALRAARRSSA